MKTPSSRTRLSPADRRRQLLELGVQLFASRPVEEVSIDTLAEEAGVSRGLLYHYFGNKDGYREAVLRHAIDDLVSKTAPPAVGEPLERLVASLGVYVDYVVANVAGYRFLVKGAAGGSGELRELYEAARSALTDRIFREDALGDIVPDTPAARLAVRGWSALVEDTVLTWVDDPHGLTREGLISFLALSLPSLVELA